MAEIQVILDSTANVPDEMLKQHANLHVVPLKIILGEQQWPEHKLPVTEMLRLAAERRINPRTSQPSPGDFAEVLQPLTEAGHEAIVITLSGGVSGTVQSAATAARMCKSAVEIIDSGTTAIGMVRMAEAALARIAAGLPAKAVADYVRAISRRTHTLIVPDTLEYLHKGGRIGGAAAIFGAILQIKPVLYLVNGKVDILDKVRTKQKAVLRALDELKKFTALEYIGVVHIEAPEEGHKLKIMIEELFPDSQVSLTAGGAVLAAHLGPGVIGIIFQEKEECSCGHMRK